METKDLNNLIISKLDTKSSYLLRFFNHRKLTKRKLLVTLSVLEMKVRLFRQDTVEDFADDHSNAKKHFTGWLLTLKYADWEEPADITASLKGNLLAGGSNRVVFDI